MASRVGQRSGQQPVVVKQPAEQVTKKGARGTRGRRPEQRNEFKNDPKTPPVDLNADSKQVQSPPGRKLSSSDDTKRAHAYARVVARANNYEDLPAGLKRLPEFFLAFASRKKDATTKIPDEVLSDPVLARQLVEVLPEAYFRLPESTRGDLNVAREAIKRFPLAALRLPKALLEDPVFVAEVLPKMPGIMPNLPEKTRSDPRVFVLMLRYPGAVPLIPEKVLRDDPVVLLNAKNSMLKGIEKYGEDAIPMPWHALPAPLREQPEITLGYLQLRPETYYDLPEPMRSSPPLAGAIAKYLEADDAVLERIDLTAEQLADPKVARAVARGVGLIGLRAPQLEDAELVELALKAHPEQFPSAPAAFRERVDLAVAFLAKSPRPDHDDPKESPPLARLAVTLRDDPQVARAAILSNPLNFEYLSDRLHDDTELVQLACSMDGGQLHYASPRLREDKQTVLCAVRAAPEALAYASPALQRDRDVLDTIRDEALEHPDVGPKVLELLEGTLQGVELQLRGDHEKDALAALTRLDPFWSENQALVVELLRVTEKPQLILPHVPEDLLKDAAFASKLLKTNGASLRWLPEPMHSDPDVVRFAAADPKTYLVGQRKAGIPDDPKLVLPALAKQPGTYENLSEQLRSEPAVVLAAFTRDASLVQYAPARVLDDLALMAQAAVANPLLLDYLEPSRAKELQTSSPEVARAREALFAKLKELGIDFRFRFHGDMELLSEVIGNRTTSPRDDPRPMALLVYPKSDWNSALECNTMKDLSKFYRVVYHEVATDKEMVEAVRRATDGKKATILEVAGHGVQRHTMFGEDDPARSEPPPFSEAGLDSEFDQSLFNVAGLRDCVERDGHIVVKSCTTGRHVDRDDNIANLFAHTFPQANVYASTVPTNNIIRLGEDGTFLSAGFWPGKVYHVRPHEV